MSIRNSKFTRTNHTQATQEALRQKRPNAFGTTPAPWGTDAGKIEDAAFQQSAGVKVSQQLRDLQAMKGASVPAEDSKDAHDTHPECNVPD
jgi:hypothetical protein